jgi:Zn-finger nucleic acid-binding protein
MIVACPACDSRYDVSGYAVGQQLRCRCGTVFVREAASAQAGQLACPHCGAGVAPTSATCEHCSSELLLKACPRCMHRVFHGHKHCPDCGAELDVAAEGTVRPDLPCPRCTTALHARLVGDIVIDECGTCLGLFLDQVAIKRVIEDRAQARAEALLGALPRTQTQLAPRPGEKMYVRCPACQTLMNRRQFASGAGVVVDVCKQHGTFFDAGELPAIVEFVMKGGLEQAARRDLERERARLAREKDQVSAIRREAYTIQLDPGGARGRAVVDLLFSLFS